MNPRSASSHVKEEKVFVRVGIGLQVLYEDITGLSNPEVAPDFAQWCLDQDNYWSIIFNKVKKISEYRSLQDHILPMLEMFMDNIKGFRPKSFSGEEEGADAKESFWLNRKLIKIDDSLPWSAASPQGELVLKKIDLIDSVAPPLNDDAVEFLNVLFMDPFSPRIVEDNKHSLQFYRIAMEHGILSERNWRSSREANSDHIEMSRSNLDQLTSRLSLESTQAISSLHEAHKKLVEGAKAAEKIKEKMSSAHQMAEAVQNALEEKLNTEAAHAFWDKKAKGHDRKVRRLSLITVLLIVLVLVCVGLIISNLVSSDSPIADFGSIRGTLILSLTLVVGTMLFWTGRVLTRLLLGNVHLANDARERVSLIETYISFLSKGEMSEDERKFMLVTLFRPSTDGVVKDDGAPMISATALLSGLGAANSFNKRT
ncbi:MAG: DUF6161 domain-containing protein [Litorimonas sp.]